MPIHINHLLVGLVIGLILGYGAFAVMNNRSPAPSGSQQTVSTNASVQYLLYLPGINGTSTIPGYTNYIKIDSWSFASSSGSSTSTGIAGTAPQSNSTPTSISFSALTSKASPQISRALSQGTPFKNATIIGVKNVAGQQTTVQIIKLTNCLIASYQSVSQGGQGVNAPGDQFTIRFQSFTMSSSSS